MRQAGEQRLGFIIMGWGPAEAGRWKQSRKIGEADSTAMPNPLSLVLNHWSNTHFILVHDLTDWKKGLGHQSAALDRIIFILCEHPTLSSRNR
jgi:hypothetical protein